MKMYPFPDNDAAMYRRFPPVFERVAEFETLQEAREELSDDVLEKTDLDQRQLIEYA